MPTQVTHQTKHDWSAAWLLFLAGATIEEIADMCKIPYRQVINYSATHLWQRRRTHAKATAFKAVNNNLAERIQQHRVKHQNYMLDQLERTQEHIEELEIGKTKEDREAGMVTVGHLLGIVDQHDTIARRTLKLDEDSTTNPLEQGFAFLVAMSKGIQSDSSFVNETPIMEVETEKVVEISEVSEAREAPENTTSAVSPFKDYLEAITGNNRPIIGHIIGMEESQNAPKTAIISEPEAGAPPNNEPGTVKPMPATLTFR